MPRIPSRTTPYDSPGRQHRHFKSKRDQILRILGRASYINGSQFAILWISARGEAETFASPALQVLLKEESSPQLFNSTVLERAKLMAEQAKSAMGQQPLQDLNSSHHQHQRTKSVTNHTVPCSTPSKIDKSHSSQIRKADGKRKMSDMTSGQIEEEDEEVTSEEELDDDEDSAMYSPRHPRRKSTSRAQSLLMSPVKMEGSERFTKRLRASLSPKKPVIQHTDDVQATALSTNLVTNMEVSKSQVEHKPTIQSLQTSHSIVQDSICETPEISQGATLEAPTMSREVRSNSSTTSSSSRSYSNHHSHTATFTSPQAIYAFLENKFNQLQQSCCKTVAKSWLKVIEPKKQTNFPYQGGEATRPTWWPHDVRHREPDHLMKPERVRLLMVILGCGRVPIQRLQLATSEMSSRLPLEKMAILRDVYKVAQEEERLRMLWPGGAFQPFTVELAPARSGYEGVSVPEGDEVGAIVSERQAKRVRTASAPRPRLSDPLSHRPGPQPLQPNEAQSSKSHSLLARAARHIGHRYSGSFPGTVSTPQAETGLMTPHTIGLTTIEQFPVPDLTYSLPNAPSSMHSSNVGAPFQLPYVQHDYASPNLQSSATTPLQLCGPDGTWQYPTPIQPDMFTFDPSYLARTGTSATTITHDTPNPDFFNQFWNLNGHFANRSYSDSIDPLLKSDSIAGRAPGDGDDA